MAFIKWRVHEYLASDIARGLSEYKWTLSLELVFGYVQCLWSNVLNS